MSDTQRPNPLVHTPEDEREFTFVHPLNPQSEIRLKPLSLITGMRRAVVQQGRVAPGKESYVYHSHRYEEEWMYILSGRAIVEIDDEELEVGPGDFLGFPTPSSAHQLRNPFGEEVVYLMGGEHKEVEIAEFPRLGKRLIRDGQRVEVVEDASFTPLIP